MSMLLIRAKLHPPQLNRRVIARPRLLAHLREQPERRLTMVVAPAGFGKTTIVAQWLFALQAQPSHLQVAWLTLDTEDSAIERCWRYLIAAITQVFPASCTESLALLDAQQLPPPRSLADVLANDLTALPNPLVLVLDDYHQITNQDIHDALMRLVAHLPTHVQLVIVSRSTVPWTVGRLRGQGLLTDLRAADLRFTTGEVRELLQQTLGTAPLDEVTTLLHTRTEGWAVGLQLASLSLHAAPDIAALAQGLRGTNRHIADYLLDEVLESQPAALQHGLLVSALPERICAALCAHLLEAPSVDAVQAMIAKLEQQGLFLVALDDTGTWYRYHHLVRDLLVFRLTEACGTPAVTALHRRCSTWFAAQGLIEEAVRHALLTGDTTLAADLVANSYSDLIEHEDGLTRLAPLLALLPKAATLGSPRLLLAHAFACIIRLDMVAFVALTRQIVARLTEDHAASSAEDWTDLRGELALFQGIACFWTGDFVRATTLSEEACQHIPRTRTSLYALAAMCYEATLFYRGAPNRASTLMRDHLGLVSAPTSTADGMILVGITYMNLLGGKLEQMAHTARHLIVDRPNGNRFFSCYGQYFLGLYHYERNELAAAEGCFVQASSFPYHVQEQVAHDSLLGLARIALARNELERAADYARRGRAFAEERTNLGLLEASSAFEATLALAQGDPIAASWLVQRIDPTPYTGHSLRQEQTCWCRAAVQIAQATPASLAEAEANLVRYLAEAAHNPAWQIRAGALLAVAHAAKGEAEAALATLQWVVTLAAPRGFLRSLLDCGPPLGALLRRLAPGDPNAAYIAQVLAAFPLRPAHKPDPTLGLPPQAATDALTLVQLTEREREILALLAERLTDKEIAVRLLIAVTTVRTHIRNIYSKLEVANRRAAISRARELGLVATLVLHP